ncbi:type II toxin-antitoxin system RelE/ParE family toxin [Geomonas azotofigens]|uniref:type II toxin-antitoxin system RelE/ParE family toxin n=1 Tax=Geomonas azotofigens TaxID=2843196 RepID=UPI001C129403|nr:type II toxin-antitoxin system RelE/ParE family toxin [Geomonas azotofigens]MBU5614456.1 type II toxin-antitoxin system RelE/ParE family toxin [Geomonas azotofigens]
MTFIGKTRHFAKWAKQVGVSDAGLRSAVNEMRKGLIDADLGGGVIKKRLGFPGRGKSGSTRTLLATNKRNRWIFIFGFEKNVRSNISKKELEALQALAKDLLGINEVDFQVYKESGRLIEVPYE